MSNCINTIIQAFKAENFTLQVLEDQHIFWIKHSENLPKKVAEKIIRELGYCPLFSEKRNGGQLDFTLVPYVIPEGFRKIVCEDTGIDADTLWRTISSTRSLRENDKPVLYAGHLIHHNPAEGENSLMMNPTKMAPFLTDFFWEHITADKSVLDLGCGNGVNSLYLLSNCRCEVTAIDRSPQVIASCKAALSHLKQPRLSIIQADIVTWDTPKKCFDLIMCVDVLPYIDSTKLKSVIDKIHRLLKPNGFFAGTLYFIEPEADDKEYLSRLGAHLYSEPALVPALLKHSGFTIQECSIRSNPYQTLLAKVVQFIATKM
jgi:SAM-dependent methyltransferase